MKGYIINSLKQRILFEEAGRIYLSREECFSLNIEPGKRHQIPLSIAYKGFDKSLPCVNDYVMSGLIREIDFSKMTVFQIEKLLDL